jgi:hypothetical protein
MAGRQQFRCTALQGLLHVSIKRCGREGERARMPNQLKVLKLQEIKVGHVEAGLRTGNISALGRRRPTES